MNVSEYGSVLLANIGEDVSTNIGLEFILQPQVGQKITFTEADGVAVGVADIYEGDAQYLANQYLTYTVKDNDITQSGRWRKQGAAIISSTQKTVGDFKRFTVLP